MTVSEAARETGFPERSLYRAIKSRKLATRSSGGSIVVEVGAVKALSANRQATGSGNSAPKTAAAADPELDAMILAKLDAGDRPLDIVRDLRVAPQRVRALAEELSRLRALERGPPVAEQLATFEAAQREQAAKVRALEELTAHFAAALEELNRNVAQRFGDLPLPAGRGEFACPCGARGFYSVKASCTYCGREQSCGFHPQRPA